MNVAIVLVVYRHSDNEIAAVMSQINSLTGGPYRVFLVDHDIGRSFGPLAPNVVVLRPATNRGFCGGVNLAARAAVEEDFDQLLLLNLDVHELDIDLVMRLRLVLLTHPDAAFVSPAIRQWPRGEKLWYRGGVILKPLWMTCHPGFGNSVKRCGGEVRRTGYFSGCCALVDLAAFIAAGGFDERLFMYYDEADLATRMERGHNRFSYLLDVPMLAHQKSGRGFNLNESYFHARNARLVLERYESGWLRWIGRLGQRALAPLQMMRCGSSEGRRQYRRGMKVSISDLV